MELTVVIDRNGVERTITGAVIPSDGDRGPIGVARFTLP
jgi:hypothetical protein